VSDGIEWGLIFPCFSVATVPHGTAREARPEGIVGGLSAFLIARNHEKLLYLFDGLVLLSIVIDECKGEARSRLEDPLRLFNHVLQTNKGKNVQKI
jgi:hypothetical protein